MFGQPDDSDLLDDAALFDGPDQIVSAAEMRSLCQAAILVTKQVAFLIIEHSGSLVARLAADMPTAAICVAAESVACCPKA